MATAKKTTKVSKTIRKSPSKSITKSPAATKEKPKAKTSMPSVVPMKVSVQTAEGWKKQFLNEHQASQKPKTKR